MSHLTVLGTLVLLAFNVPNEPYARIHSMKCFAALVILLTSSLISFAQDHAQKIYDTERAFEKMVAEKGIKTGFIEYLSPVGVIFRPGPVNGKESWSSRPESPAALTWNPIRIEVSANGALGYSVGNSIYRPKGKNDTDQFYGHYITVWARQPNGEYRAALDTGINHPQSAKPEPDWKPGQPTAAESNENRLFAGDSSISFFRLAENRGLKEAYKRFAADDIYMLRDGHQPFVGRDAAIDFVDSQKSFVKFVRRRSFIEAGDLAYVYSEYSMRDKNGVETEKGNFVQVWKLRSGKWVIAADLFLPLPADKN